MTSCPYVEAVDPNLQAVAHEALHWRHTDEHTCELHKRVEEPRLDGFDKPTTQLLGRIQYDPDMEQYLGYVHAWPPGGQDPPLMLVSVRFHKLLAQNEVIEFLLTINRL
ncbi:hypothetical protein [Fibrella forsythiae]|uniref:Uncharacterized protein n=1 Tax=Fibrella forsythiae TaxID=2817061 RepID=A0ABS3JVG4_9BACT|nr:hypothetical protein [Fibrella forsythiae]MBO0952907.1 hypothetical protein [Fibrella forsythiae]